MLEEATRVEREQLIAEIAGEFGSQGVQQKQDAELTKDWTIFWNVKFLNLKISSKLRKLPGNKFSMIKRQEVIRCYGNKEGIPPLSKKRIDRKLETFLTSNYLNCKC